MKSFIRHDLRKLTDKELRERSKAFTTEASKTKKHWTNADWEVIEIIAEQERRQELAA